MLRSAVGIAHVSRSVLVMGLWIKARGLGQGCTRPAGRPPGRPIHIVLHHPNRRTVIRLAHHIMANRDIICHLAKVMDRVETPFGFQPIISTFVRHTVSRCLIFPVLPEVARVTSKVNTIGFLQFLPTGLHGLCFGCCFSGPLYVP